MPLTKSEAVYACQNYAKRRWRPLPPVHSAFLIKPDATKTSLKKYEGSWSVVFKAKEQLGNQGTAYFLVDDQTGKVTWENGPAPWWHEFPVFLLGWLIDFALLPFY